ncbi:hypothetical protein TNIN_25561 [Trichonephila inaurata madagascariensis]|uniref:Uncharacterized protein n=1 Tax=Trichonephila inaurata madagascariensis TaxID=2747483 RepID=A0A8X7CJL8_9ARAC|nr:hypothetical protein TNIN_25561 [Trichonephila inaurata madagascariensis]
MDTDSVSRASFKSRSSISSLSESTTSYPPVTDCQKRRQALDDIQSLDKNIATHRTILENEKKTGKTELIPKIQKRIDIFLEIRKKMASELRTMPPCLDPNCTDHTILKPNDSDSDLSHINDKKQSQKRKNNKQDLDGFAFPKKTTRPTTPTQVLQPIPTRNNFESRNQDPEPMEEEYFAHLAKLPISLSGRSKAHVV